MDKFTAVRADNTKTLVATKTINVLLDGRATLKIAILKARVFVNPNVDETTLRRDWLGVNAISWIINKDSVMINGQQV